MVSCRMVVALLAVAAAMLFHPKADAAAGEPSSYCGGAYSINDKYWEANSPDLAMVLGRLPANRSRTSGNILSLNYARDSKGNLLQQAEFDRHWTHIFGKSTSTGYGTRLRGAYPKGAASSWGLATKAGRKNLSECVVDGTDTAICLGIPSGKINVSSLGHHGTWAVLDPAGLEGSVGTRACIVYDVMFSSNFDFRGLDGKLPGLTNAPAKVAAPSDQLCAGRTRLVNDGSVFSTRLGFTDAGGSPTRAAVRVLNQFRNDMFAYDCTADGSKTNNEYLTQMRAVDPGGWTEVIQRGVWYRLEHELVMNSRFETVNNLASGASSKVWLYRKSDEALMRSYGRQDNFAFDANRDGRPENYPLLPRTDAGRKINGIFMSVQQGGNLPGAGPWKMDYVIAMRNFGLFLE
ncbi:hypothetical protein [Geminicoccus roseus]|uniref:hypothetical protein n=1 Tax=Geminicoccus roseus TaxID=404900 RepID=UPI000422C859|nr:hypothetical protein [Geminicoccus roseus]